MKSPEEKLLAKEHQTFVKEDWSKAKVLMIRLPCNPIFPIGPIYLADHLHKCFPKLKQNIIDLAAIPLLDVERILISSINDFKPSKFVTILNKTSESINYLFNNSRHTKNINHTYQK